MNSNENRSSYDNSLQEDLDRIYETYTKNGNRSFDTLDTNDDQEEKERVFRVKRIVNYHKKRSNVYPSTHISSMGSNDSQDETKSAPQTSNSSSSFDFITRNHQAMTTSSLNLLNSPGSETNFKDLQISTPGPLQTSSDISDKSISCPEDNENWNDRGAAVRKVTETGQPVKYIKRGVRDFEFGRSLGEGSYSTVVLATDKHTSKQYAVKILDKRHIIKEKKVMYVNIEKHALNRLSNKAGIISLYFTFQDKDSLYFVLDFAANGELLTLIKNYNTLNEDCVKHWGAQILDAIRYMHLHGVVHRDIKPENILLDEKMKVQITDFGTAKLLEKSKETGEYPSDIRAKSFVGTAEYVSPELLENKYCGKGGDIWAYGCILYQMIAGKPPFKAPNEYLTFQKITKLQYAFSAGFPSVLRDLIKKILVLQPSKRYTVSQIQEHYFFSSKDWSYSSIWDSPPPEIGPYKMTAKSMTTIPQLAKTSSSAQISTKSNGQKSSANLASADNEQKRLVSESKTVNPASVAAFVLNKKDISDGESNDEGSGYTTDTPPLLKTPSGGGASRQPSSEYIPGTNILRPYIRPTVMKSSLSNKKTLTKKSRSEIIEDEPLTSLDKAWVRYFNHASERILKIGQLEAFVRNTEYFERKYKGLLHDSPLGFSEKFFGIKNKNGSLLTQVVQGNSKGLRSISNVNEGSGASVPSENNVVIVHRSLEELTIPMSGESTSGDKPSSKEKKSSILKKIFMHPDKTLRNEFSGEMNDETTTKSTSPEGRHTYTVMITTHGRLLLFYRDNNDMSFELVYEIFLNASFLQIKEIVSGVSDKKSVTPGLFAIISSETTFVFQVDGFDVNVWTESLAKARLNQHEREGGFLDEKEFKPKNSNSGGFMPSQKSNPPSPAISSSPKVSNSPNFSQPSPNQGIGKRSPRIRQTEFSPSVPSRDKSLRRRPPPPMKSRPNSPGPATAGMPDDAVTMYAAQLAVSHHPSATTHEKHKHSFKKESSSSKHQGHVTSMNSKLLARSQRKK
ncbi:Piso0_001516 [Millerozyma farinosa CBS 7064]|uniref:non-specific serine/threonine protein kinase n=1 Tax=Pichia sorbitophila (strain ATCC MYA-4447 / BCRC 22081 / CBS 7064 / NBRC 10061 / NRRL Y-12695) TaxID=559304 RepID=G8YND4_PICSO|nr:Piso0_001516 [Millerozyma farinosa CBS 7064]